MKRLFIDIFQNIAAEFAEVFEILEVFVNLCGVNFQIFMNEKISQACHWSNLFGKPFRYDIICSENQNRVFVVARPVKTKVSDNIMTDIEEALNG